MTNSIKAVSTDGTQHMIQTKAHTLPALQFSPLLLAWDIAQTFTVTQTNKNMRGITLCQKI